MRVNWEQWMDLWLRRGGYMCLQHSAVEWPAISTTTLNPVTLEPRTLQSVDHDIFIGLRWIQSYWSMWLAASCATESNYCIIQAIESTCHNHRLLVTQRDLPWILLPTSLCQWHQDTPGSWELSIFSLKWRLTSSAERTLTPQSWHKCFSNTSSANAV